MPHPLSNAITLFPIQSFQHTDGAFGTIGN